MDYLVANWQDIVVIASATLGALVAVATVIAPLTANKIDDKAVGVLGVLKSLVDRLKVTK